MAERNKFETYDTRKILEQMKEEYWQGLNEAEQGSQEDQLQLVTFWLADEFYAADAALCKNIIKVPPIVKVPRVPAHVLGVTNLRGKITSVVDLRRLFGLPEKPLTDKARLLVVETEEVSTALLTERVVEITLRPSAALQGAGAGSSQMRAEYIKGYYQEEETTEEGTTRQTLLIYLDLEKILRAKEMVVDFRGR